MLFGVDAGVIQSFAVNTNSIAQGGGKSLPIDLIGEVNSCDARGQSNATDGLKGGWRVWLSTCLSNYLFTYLSIYHLLFLSVFLPVQLSMCLAVYLLI